MSTVGRPSSPANTPEHSAARGDGLRVAPPEEGHFVLGPAEATHYATSREFVLDPAEAEHYVVDGSDPGSVASQADRQGSPKSGHYLPTGFGPYEIESLLGSGGMGDVYRARDIRLGRTVAVKVLRPDLSRDRERRAQFATEARSVSALTHPHIRTVFDIGSEGGLDFLVLEYLEGETLDRILARRPLSVARSLTYAIQIADALDAAHRRGIVHGDVKPANIMITASGVKLLDFGLARLAEPTHDPAESTATDHATIPGTTPYLAPERLEGRVGDPRSDVFALGVVVYEMIAGRRPFEGSTRARIIASILERDPAPLTSAHEAVPAALQHLVLRCLARDPDQRWQNAKDLAAELEWIASADSATLRESSQARRRQRIIPWAAAAAAVIVAAAFGVYAWSARPVSTTTHAPVRFIADAPLGASMAVSPGGFSVSPDGRHLVFIASAGTGTRQLWLRSLDSFETHPLPGTDDAWNPFWAPDSQAIAFTAGTQLRRIDLRANRVQAIAEVPSSVNGTWSRDGVILLSANTGPTRLMRISAAGGAPVDLPLPAALRGAVVSGPDFLPDGRHFIYHARTRAADTTGVYIAGIDDNEHRFVASSDSQAEYADPGFLVYLRNGSMLAQPFDPGRGAATGPPRTIPEAVSFVPGLDRGGFSISRGSVLAYRARVESSELLWRDRAGRQIGSLGTGTYINPALSPDGTRVAITRGDATAGTSDIWIIDTNGGMRQLTSGPVVENFPVWSPDGKHIAFAAERGGVMHLFEKDVNAGAADADDPLVTTQPTKMPYDWSRDGRFLLYSSFDGRGMLGARFWALPVSPGHGGDSAPVAPPSEIASSSPGKEEGQAEISPDGRWMAYVSDVSGSPQVFVRPFPHGAGRWLISTNGGFEPKWRGDGRELFYLASDQMLMAVDVDAGATFSAGQPHPLFRTNLMGAYLGSPFPNGRVRNEYAVTPDGQRFLINQPVGGVSAYAIRIVIDWQALLQ